MERYSEYKDSGVKWLGEIPSHWEVMSIKYTGIFENGLTYSPADTAKEGTLVLRSSNIQDFHLSFKDNVFVKKVSSKLLVRKGDIIICSRNGSASLVGKCALVESDIDASFGAFMMRYRPVINPKYAYYLFQGSIGYYKGLFSTTTINQLTKSVLNDIKVAIPNLEEQVVVGSYLDAATSKIDKAIAMQQKMIDLLNERKQIIIQNAVTKGLDENVEMKDSGVEWIGMIPKHWEIEPFGKHFTFGKGLPITKANLQEEGVAVISYGQVHAKYNLGTTLTETLVRYVSPKYLETHPQCLLNKNDFIFADTSEDVEGSGNFAFNDYKDKIFAGYHTVVARPKDLIYPKYYAYLFKSRAWKSQIQSLVNGVKVYSIGKRILKTSTLLIPSESEQKEIVKVLDLKTAAIEKSIENISRQIALLQERKQIIINEVVTGKVKVS